MLPYGVKKKLDSFVEEDVGIEDITTELLPKTFCKAIVVAKEDCVLAGVNEVEHVFSTSRLRVKAFKNDGEHVSSGATVLAISGSNYGVLTRERTALNVLSRMSGVATACTKASKIVKGKTRVAVTRKTLPGFNEFDKKAAFAGGALPHRTNLADAILIKDNHLAFFENIEKALKTAFKKHDKVEIEVTSLKQALEAAEAGKNKDLTIMLDNFSVKKTREAMKAIKTVNKQARIELSGGISFGNLEKYASLKPDVISMGCLTHSAKSINFSLEIIKGE